MKKRKKGDLGSLDSLLDTMTTVVGILIILLIVVQFDVQETVQRIVVGEDANLPKVTEAQVAALRSDFENKVKASAEATEKLPELKGMLSSSEFRLERMNANLKTASVQLKRSTDTEAAMAELSLLMNEQRATINELERDIADKEEMLQRMYKKVEDQPTAPLPKATNIRLPNPQPAPAGIKPRYMLCIGNRVYPVDYSELNEAVKKAIEQSRARRNEHGEIDGEAVVSFFKRLPIGNRHFRVEAQVSNYRLRFVLHRKRGGGEDVRMIQAHLSEFQKRCTAWDKKKYYLNYVVWPDSFGFYHQAREISSRYKIPTGWRPTERKELYASYFGEYWTYGAKKNKPKPAPPPKTPAPPVKPPQNVLD